MAVILASKGSYPCAKSAKIIPLSTSPLPPFASFALPRQFMYSLLAFAMIVFAPFSTKVAGNFWLKARARANLSCTTSFALNSPKPAKASKLANSFG